MAEFYRSGSKENFLSAEQKSIDTTLGSNFRKLIKQAEDGSCILCINQEEKKIIVTSNTPNNKSQCTILKFDEKGIQK